MEGICGISTDIPDLRRTELALREAVAKLERERDNKLTNVGAIMAAIAHEVRQPLMAIVINGSAAAIPCKGASRYRYFGFWPSRQMVHCSDTSAIGVQADIARTVVNLRLRPCHASLIGGDRRNSPSSWRISPSSAAPRP